MIETFNNLDAEKKRRILNAALDVFSASGYKQSAMDDIVARAGISKGALFHYFGSKSGLYIYLIDFVVDTYMSQVYEKIDFNETDLFVRLRQAIKARLELSITYPSISLFWERAKGDPFEEALLHMRKKAQVLEPLTQDFMKNLDFSRFKKDLDVHRSIKVLLWTFDSFSNDVIRRCKESRQPPDWEKEYAEAEQYLAYFQDLFYRETP